MIIRACALCTRRARPLLSGQARQWRPISVAANHAAWTAAVARGAMKSDDREGAVRWVFSVDSAVPDPTVKVGKSLVKTASATVWRNAEGLELVVGRAWQGLARKSLGLLASPPATLQGSWNTLLRVYSEEEAMALVKKSPSILMSPAETVNGALGALLGMFDGDNEAVMALVLQSPGILRSPAETINGAHGALLDIWDGDNEAVMALVRRDSRVITARAPTLLRNFQALAARLGSEARALEHLDQHSPKAIYRNPVVPRDLASMKRSHTTMHSAS